MVEISQSGRVCWLRKSGVRTTQWGGLQNGYSAEVDLVSREGWRAILDEFEDGNLYQTWEFGSTRSGERNLSHLVLRLDGKLVGAAQIRMRRLAHFGIGVAYVKGGPLWRLRDSKPCLEHFRVLLHALSSEYCKLRRLVLRVVPNEFEVADGSIGECLATAGYSWQGNQRINYVIDIKPPMPALLQGMSHGWRQSLRFALRQNYEVKCGDEAQVLADFLRVYQQLLRRKRFVDFNDPEEFLRMHSDFGARSQSRVMVCYDGQRPLAAILVSCIGSRGLFLLGGTADLGLSRGAFLLLHWKTMDWLKQRRAELYDLGTINPNRSSGTYRFKKGIAPRSGMEIKSLGDFEITDDRLAGFIGHWGLSGLAAWRNSKLWINSVVRHFRP